MVDEPLEEGEEEKVAAEDEVEDSEDEDGVVEEEETKEKEPKTKQVEKTTWDWVLINDTKPIWLRRWEDNLNAVDGRQHVVIVGNGCLTF